MVTYVLKYIVNSLYEVKGAITFLSPEDYPACLWIGKK